MRLVGRLELAIASSEGGRVEQDWRRRGGPTPRGKSIASWTMSFGDSHMGAREVSVEPIFATSGHRPTDAVRCFLHPRAQWDS